jgi:hypothetical protein
LRGVGRHACGDIEKSVHGIIEIAHGDALTKDHEVARSRKGSTRDNEPLNSGPAQSGCQILASGMVVRDQFVRGDSKTTGSCEVNLHERFDFDTKRPGTYAKFSEIVGGSEVFGPKHLRQWS